MCRLHKSLYGLKQSPRNWNRKISKWLKKYGLRQSRGDPCLYTVVDGSGGMLIVVLYVDDLLIAGSSLTVVEAFKKAIAAEFEMKDMGEAKWILGMEIVRDLEKGTIELKQRAYFERVLERFGMSRCKPVDTPAEERLRRLPEGQGGPDKTYMSLVGALLYGAVMTRPDILYAVSSLGRHLQATGPDHWRAAKRVLKYLKGTLEVGIVYGGQGAKELELEVYSDADWG